MTLRDPRLVKYQESVSLKYQIYSALFLTLPFDEMKDIDAEVLTFSEYSRREIQSGASPDKVVKQFFSQTLRGQDFDRRIKILFLLLQFLERDVVLLDALENAAFLETHQSSHLDFGPREKRSEIAQFLKSYRVRVVLTAHPTQFYPFQVLEIIEDLAESVKANELGPIQSLLLQLGKTSFKNQNRLTPLDEVEVHIYFLEKIFYPVYKAIQWEIYQEFPDLDPILELGFWPGGDRDGNPFVTAEVTITTIKKLKKSIIGLYIQDIEGLKRRLTFPEMWPRLDAILHRLNATQLDQSVPEYQPYLTLKDFIDELTLVRDLIIQEHRGLFLEVFDRVLLAVKIFGFHFAKLDLRQDSRIHGQVLDALLKSYTDLDPRSSAYLSLNRDEQLDLLRRCIDAKIRLPSDWKPADSMAEDLIASLKAAHQFSLERYIISNSQSMVNVIEILVLAQLAGIPLHELRLKIVPLFETITDLQAAPMIMTQLYQDPIYQKHLARQDHSQTIMLGFSDGTKDGGYLMANWAIARCKMQLHEIAKQHKISLDFFDGRGGSPARGGGSAEQFYRALSHVIDQKQIQLTIQGQTISTDFASTDVAQYHIERLVMAGLRPLIETKTFHLSHQTLLDELASHSYQAYEGLKQDPLFVPYLEKVSPILFYGELNNASRPPRRNLSGALQLKDLRAIPYVGSWSQVKQNVPVYFGMGTAFDALIQQGKETELKDLYQQSLFFRALIDNAMQSVCKINFALTSYMKNDPIFGGFWDRLKQEADLTIAMIKRITDQTELLESDPVTRASITQRESIVIPLLVIQQYALIELSQPGLDPEQIKLYHKLIVKTLAASTNASRHST